MYSYATDDDLKHIMNTISTIFEYNQVLFNISRKLCVRTTSNLHMYRTNAMYVLPEDGYVH
jgi:hypothetical protein